MAIYDDLIYVEDLGEVLVSIPSLENSKINFQFKILILKKMFL